MRLLDVNVLVALAWPNHIHHRRADAWFRSIRQTGWATCPVTESGFVRISSNAKALDDALMPQEARVLLRRVRDMPGHVFWSDDVSPAAPRESASAESAFAKVVGYRQFTDAHLLTLAMDRGGRLATFDEGVAQLTPPGASDAVEVIP
ncbi:MAG: VapC toxin family PIN domain ribonuclease [Gemmatimonadales bacterium]|nr:VapC toxin family PIN domain ribonuclease [Gemmatimonadales bacterium]MYC88976.1 VapC toxin family PIN domain ribonuclease [Candidatus Palauibacter denitrificans]